MRVGDTAARGTRAGSLETAAGLVLLFGVAAALRVYAWHQTSVLFNDGPIFLALADALRAGRVVDVLAHPFHPLYPAAIAGVQAATGLTGEWAAVGVSIFGGLLAIAGVGAAVACAFDRALGWVAAWTVALHPWAVDFSSDVMSDGLYAGLFLVGFAGIVSWNARPTFAAAMLAGGATGLAYLTRPEGLGLLVVAAAVGALAAWRRPAARRRLLATGGVGLLVLGALAVPFVIGLSDGSGDLTLTRKKTLEGLTAGHPTVPIPSPPARDAAGATSPRAGEPRSVRASTDPLPLPRSSERVGERAYDLPPRSVIGALEAVSRALRTALAAFRYEVALFAVLGLVALRGRVRLDREALFALPAVLYTGLLVLLVWGAGYVARRHALAAWLPLVAYAALGWRHVAERSLDRALGRATEARPRRGTARAVVAALVGVLVVVWGARDLRPRRLDRAPVRAAAEWVAAHAGEGRAVAAQKLRVAYYARGRHVPLPSGKTVPIEATLRAAGAEWLVIDEQRLDDHHGLAGGIGDWLQLAHLESGEGRRVLVLEIR